MTERRVLEIAPSTYYAVKAVERDPELASVRTKQDSLDMATIKKAFDGNQTPAEARRTLEQFEGPRTPRLPKLKPRNMKSRPANSRYK